MLNNYIYTVKQIKKPLSNVGIISLSPKDTQLAIKEFLPGQFISLALNLPGLKKQQRAFSLANAPENLPDLELAIKAAGQVSTSLINAAAGAEVIVNGPFGLFTFSDKMSEVVFIAGGIGIAPIMSMIRHFCNHHLPTKATLIYSSKTEAALYYRNELDTLAASNPNVKIIYTLTEAAPDDWPYFTGRVDEPFLKKQISDFAKPYFFICGPRSFNEAMLACLKKNSVPENRIKFEYYY